MNSRTSKAFSGIGLERIFAPQSIAVVGASSIPTKIGAVPLGYLKQNGFSGRLFPINPAHNEIQGFPAYPSMRAVGEPIDLAIFALPAAGVEAALEDAISAGVASIVMFSAGFAELGAGGERLQRRIALRAAQAGIRILGPNCLGFVNPRKAVYATFSPVLAQSAIKPGVVGLVSQSGAFGAYACGMARELNVGLSTWVTTGNECDIQVADCIEWMASDPDTKVILAYMEGCREGSKLKRALSAARAAGKPVVVVKAGRTAVGAMAAASHTASLAGDDTAYDALFRQYGAWRARTIEEFFDIARCLAVGGVPPNSHVGLLTVSGGVGALMADDASDAGLLVTELPQEAQDRIRARIPLAGTRNPVDVTGQIITDLPLLEPVAQSMLREGGYGSLVIFRASAGLNEPVKAMQRHVVNVLKEEFPDRVIMFSTLTDPEQRMALEQLGASTFLDPSRAIRVVSALAYFRSQQGRASSEPPSSVGPVFLRAGTYNEADALDLLSGHGI